MSVPVRDIAIKKRTKFSFRHLLIFTAIVGAVLVPIALWGIDGVLGSFVLGILIFMLWRRSFYSFAGGLLLMLLAVVVLAPLRTPTRAAKRSICLNNMRQLVLACHNYQSVNGKLPPQFTVDANGKPLHSWRLLILPYLDEGSLYNAIDLTKPWNHPVNLKYAKQMPDVFRCHSYKPNPRDKNPDAMTTYLAVVGEETMWHPTAGGLNFDDVTDGCSNTIMILESVAHRVNWMSPQDLDLKRLLTTWGMEIAICQTALTRAVDKWR